MILINLELNVRADQRQRWMGEIRRYADAVRAEDGCLFFDCFESIDAANQFAIIEGFASQEAGAQHTSTDYFAEFIAFLPSVLADVPKIINVEAPQDGWSAMSELDMDGAAPEPVAAPVAPAHPLLADHPLPPATPGMAPAIPEMLDRLEPGSFQPVPGAGDSMLRPLPAVGSLANGQASASVYRVAPGGEWATTPWHMNDCAQFAYVSQGWTDFEFEELGVVRMHAGDSMLMPAFCRHRELTASPDFELIQVTLAEAFTSTVWSFDPEDGSYRERQIEDAGKFLREASQALVASRAAAATA